MDDRRARRALGRADHDALAVELRRAAARPGRARVAALGRQGRASLPVARGGRRGARCSCSRSRSALRLDLGDSGSLDKATSGPLRPDARRRRPRAREAAARLGLGRVQRRVPRATRRAPAARRRRPRTRSRSRSPPSRASSASRPTSRCSCSRSCGCCAARAASPVRAAIAAGLRRARAAHLALRRVPRGPGDLDAARARHRARRSRRGAPPSRTRTRRRRSTATAASRSSWRARPRDGDSRFARPVERAALALAVARRGARLGDHAHLSQLRLLLPPGVGAAAARRPRADVQAYAAPTQHPLYVALGAVLGLVFGESADRALVLVCLLSHALLVFGTYRLGAAVFGRWSGALAALFVAASASFLLYAARGYVDSPFLALVVWAGVLEAERPRSPLGAARRSRACCGPRRGCSPGLRLAVVLRGAGPPRLARCSRGRGRPRRSSGRSPTSSSPATRCTRCTRPPSSPTTSAACAGSQHVPGSFVSFVGATVRPPVARAGADRRRARRGACSAGSALRVPLALFAAGVITFVGTGVLGLSILPRYLTVPAVALCLFAGYALLGFTTLGATPAGAGAGPGRRPRPRVRRRDRADHPRARR